MSWRSSSTHLRICLAGVLLATAGGGLTGSATPDDLDQALSAITPRLIKSHVRFLSHDLLEGRDTGERGYAIAAQYVASQFERLGLEPIDGRSYLQPFEVAIARADAGSRLETSGLTILPPDVAIAPDWTRERPTVQVEAVYVGFGVVTPDRDDYAGVDVQGKAVVLLQGLPKSWADDPELSLLGRLKHEIAARRGATAVVSLITGVLPGESQESWRRQRGPAALADGSAPSVRPDAVVGPDASRRLFAAWGLDTASAVARANTGAAPRPIGEIKIHRRHEIDRVTSWNVGGIVRGSGAPMRDEVVVFTAHLDHVGMGEPDEHGDRIFNGTHDNALGTAKMLAGAEAAARLRPQRSLLFLSLGAEERGLLGAWHYVRNPAFPIERTAAAINQDGGLENEATADVFAFGAEFSSLAENVSRVAASMNMFVNDDLRPPFSPSQALLFRSDQYPFLLAGVPAVYLMPGYVIAGDSERGRTAWTNYLDGVNHRQRDNFDASWTFESPVRMARLALRLGVAIANADEMPRTGAGEIVRRTRQTPDRPYFLDDGFLRSLVRTPDR